MTENNLENVNIGGDYTGGNKSFNFDASAVSALNNSQQMEKFSMNAQKYIAEVAEKILDLHDVKATNQGLNFSKLQEKFQNVQCTKDYIKNFNKASAHFHEIDQIHNGNTVEGGELTIRCIMTLITKLYSHFFPECLNGDIIHNKILSQIIDAVSEKEELIATDILIYYTVNECGIFNERK